MQLRQREKYLRRFRKFTVIIKHGQRLDIFQLINRNVSYLNSEEVRPFFMESVRSKKRKFKDTVDRTKKGIKNKFSVFV